MWQVFRNKDPVTGKSKGQQAKDLLKRYGGAYLITSISFAVVSFAACYALVSAGMLSRRFLTLTWKLCEVSTHEASASLHDPFMRHDDRQSCLAGSLATCKECLNACFHIMSCPELIATLPVLKRYDAALQVWMSQRCCPRWASIPARPARRWAQRP